MDSNERSAGWFWFNEPNHAPEREDEKRVTNARTGGQKGRKRARYDLIPPQAMHALAEHFGYGAEKYEDRNWERGVDWSLSFAAMQRHLWAWWGGEDADPDGTSTHLAAAMWHCAALITYTTTHCELDDRPSTICSWSSDGGQVPPEDFDWDSVRRVVAEDCPKDTAYLLNPEWMYPPPEPAWLEQDSDFEKMLNEEREIQAQADFDEDFLDYLDWRDANEERTEVNIAPAFRRWVDTR